MGIKGDILDRFFSAWFTDKVSFADSEALCYGLVADQMSLLYRISSHHCQGVLHTPDSDLEFSLNVGVKSLRSRKFESLVILRG